MKTIFFRTLFLFFLLVAHCTFGQPAEPDVSDHTPKSPEAATLIKFQDIPVSHYTGIPQVNIPITSINERSLTIPISLNYHAGGHNVSQVANWVGLGWKFNAGGMITRKVRGLPDDFKDDSGLPVKSFLDLRAEYDYQEVEDAWSSNATYEQRLLLDNMAAGCYDAEPDEFYFDALGYSGTFAFSWDNQETAPKVISKDKIIIDDYFRDPNENYRITSWSLLTPDGIRLVFEAVESTYSFPATPSPTSCSALPKTYNSGWHLSYIQSVNIPNVLMQLYYEDYTYQHTTTSDNVTFLNWGASPSCSGSVSGNLSYTSFTNKIFGKRLTDIHTSSGRYQLTVSSNTPRTDVMDLSELSNFNRLDEIILYGGNNKIITKHRLNYKSNTSRLMLASVEQIGRDGGTLPPYSFEYNNQQLPASIRDKGMDHWGFYNGAYNLQLTPSMDFLITPTTPFNYPGANREPSESHCKAAILEEVTYPTGATVSMDYELHDYSYVSSATVESQGAFVTEDQFLITSATGDSDVPGQYISTESSFHINFEQNVKINYNGTTWVTFGPFTPKFTIYDENDAVVLQGFIPPDPDTPPNSDSDNALITLDTGSYRLVCMAMDYEFDNEANEDFITVSLEYQEQFPNTPLTTKKAGGLRIKSLATHDPYSGETITRSFTYGMDNGTGYSSGVINGEPKYYYETSAFQSISTYASMVCSYKNLQSNTSVVFGQTHGNHIGYAKVTESFGDGGKYGKIVHEFTSGKDYPNTINNELPFGDPMSNDFKRGLLTSRKTYDAGNTLLQVENNVYDFYTAEIESAKVDYIMGNSGGLFGPMQNQPISEVMAPWFRPLRMGYAQMVSSNKTSYFSGSSPVVENRTFIYDNQLQLLKEESIVNSDGAIHSTEYIYAEDEPLAGAIGCLLSNNMVGIPIKVLNKVNGTQVGGVWTEYHNYISCGAILPKNKYTYWGGWVKTEEIMEYTSDFYPKKIKPLGFNETTYTWTDGLVTKKVFNSWESNYNYDFDLRLVEQHTDIDGQVIDYDFDEFNRLQLSTARGGHITTTIDYQYGIPNKVTTTQSFSDAPAQTIVEEFDGLSRPVKKTHNDVPKQEWFYDDGGRLEKETYLVGSYTKYQYESSPLNRKTMDIFPDNNRIITTYEGDNNHYKIKTFNERGNPTSVLTDIIGRAYKTVDALGGETVNTYDIRSNLISISPPAGEAYIYTYDIRNRMESKKIPGSKIQIFRYDDATNLLKYTIDGNGNRIDFTYDEYGRETIVKHNALGGWNPDNPTAISNPIYHGSAGSMVTENIYGENTNSQINTGKMVATKAKVLGSQPAAFAQSLFTYDDFGRIERQHDFHHLGSDVYNRSYNHADWQLEESRTHNKNGSPQLSLLTKQGYDGFGRELFYNTRVEDSEAVFAVGRSFNEKDQVVGKYFSGLDPFSALDHVKYKYNLRGWLTNMNDMVYELQEANECGELFDTGGDVIQVEQEVDKDGLLDWLCQNGEDITIDDIEPCGSGNDLCFYYDYNIAFTSRVRYNNHGGYGAATQLNGIFTNTSGLNPILLNTPYPYLYDDPTSMESLETDLEAWLNANGHEFDDVEVSVDVIYEINIERPDYYAINISLTGVIDDVIFLGLLDGQTPRSFTQTLNRGLPCHREEDPNDPKSQELSLLDVRAAVATYTPQTIDYPVITYRTHLEDGSTRWIPEAALPLLTGAYYKSKRVHIADASQSVEVSYQNGAQATLSISSLIQDLGNDLGINFEDIDPNTHGEGCVPPTFNCTPQQLEEQQASLAQIQNAICNLDADDLVCPLTISMVQLCDGSIIYIPGEGLLNDLEGPYVVIGQLDMDEGDVISILVTITRPTFAMHLSQYQENGNIEEMRWKVTDRSVKEYRFTYDPLNRVTSGQYGYYTTVITNQGKIKPELVQSEEYSTPSFGYDAVGNITNIIRNGMTPGANSCLEPNEIDNLSLIYDPNTNHLLHVIDNAPAGFRSYGFKPSGGNGSGLSPYSYDNNGNLTYDANKGISLSSYNYLNLPEQVGPMQITYDATGKKWEKLGEAGTTLYINGIEYGLQEK